MVQNGDQHKLVLDRAKIHDSLSWLMPKLLCKEKFGEFLKCALLLTAAALCVFGYVLHCDSGVFQEYATAVLQMQWMLLICIVVWCGTFLFLTLSLKDLPLVGLLLIAIAAYFIGYMKWPGTDALTLLFGVTLGRGARFALEVNSQKSVVSSSLEGGKWKEEGEDTSTVITRHWSLTTFLFGLVLLLAFSSWWHLHLAVNFYHGPRWMGLWNNPNDYGLLMGVGVVLAAGVLADRRWKMENGNKQKAEIGSQGSGVRGRWSVIETLRSLRSFAANQIRDTQGLSFRIVLFVAAFMMGTGLLLSYSRGAWVGTAVGLLYLAKRYGKFKWRWVLPPILVAVATIWFFWNTPRTAPWYFQRLDLSRGSAQHRLVAWKAGFEIMWDHPFGVGWNKTVETYQKNYSPPQDGAAAIVTNDYSMLGAQLGWPGLVCFVTYAALCFRGRARHFVRTANDNKDGAQGTTRPTLDVMQAACRTGALVMLVTFWFDGGLFKLATASVFWILLELGRVDLPLSKETRISRKGTN